MLRQHDLNKAVGEMIKIRYNNANLKMDEIMSNVAKGPAPRFYVTYENARRFVSLLERGKSLPLTNKNKIEQYEEIFRRWCKRLKGKKSGNRKKFYVLEDIILEPAPSFYLSKDRISGSYYRSNRKKRGV